MNKAIIFIPGIKGTKLYDANTINNEVLWQDVRYNFEDFERLTMSFSVNDRYYDEYFDTIVKPLQLEPLAYKEFWTKLRPNPEHKWKFLFPYDWRLPNEANAELLHQFIETLMERSKSLVNTGVEGIEEINKVDIVTHSMGNVPARFYIKKYGFAKINKIVFVAPPFKGAADPISALTVGQGFFFSKDETRKMARTLPALFELLPRYGNSNVEKNSAMELDIFDINNWQENLVNKDPARPHKDTSIEKFKANLREVPARLDRLDTWMDNLSVEERDRILVLAKTDFKTFTSLLIERNPGDHQPHNYFDLNNSLYVTEGDGVVPNVSSCYYHNLLPTYAIFNEVFRNDKEHAFLMTDSRVQRIVNLFLDNNGSAAEVHGHLIGRSVKKVVGLAPKSQGMFKFMSIIA